MEALRAQFPVFERVAYLNAGTNGPVPRVAAEATEASLREQLAHGRAGTAWFEHQVERITELRARIAALMRASEADLALTGSTTDGVNAALHALDLRAGDEVLTTDEEHPGVLAPLATMRDMRGVRVRVVPFEELPGEVGEETRAVACSHVSWATGRVMDAGALAETGVTVILDGAQGLGAIPLDVGSLGCDFYAASGQKWLCGPNGIGYLYVRPELVPTLPAPWSGYHALEDPARGLDPALWPDARRLSTGFPPAHHVEWAHASLDVLDGAGFDGVHERALSLARRLAELLAERGVTVTPRGHSTLVSFEVPDPPAFADRAAAEGIVLRGIPNRPWARASVGAWTTEDELARVAELAAGA